MANLKQEAVWENGIYQLETTDPVMGGPDGIDNLQAIQLGNRTLYLRQKGIAPWDNTLTYSKDSVVIHNSILYISLLKDNTNQTPASSPLFWSAIIDGKYLPATKNGDAYDVSSQVEFKKTPTVNGSNVLTEETSTGRLLNIIKFEQSGTYTPSEGTKFIIVEAVGGGGAGGGAQSNSTSAVSIGSGGGGGAYCKSKLLISEIGNSVSVVVGAGGSGVLGTTGGNGGDSTFGELITAGGGKGGVKSGPSESQFMTGAASGGIPLGGNILNSNGDVSEFGLMVSVAVKYSGKGGKSFISLDSGTGTAKNKEGYSASGYGCGGGGACMYDTSSSYKGGDGYQGVVIIQEYA